ncbi:DODA-type extradiol aromatic ring-opening family dioxygenase [Qingshengfaniella alkalisoli]|uniref:DODA-type extradiol aromatic ring-opening family dioxygenase n=1 Tax=Qingshengfaniella alkalisoli TaxID=2599296 RepID=UPI001F0F6B8E|nr:dioxygenase [Qingshengfaniella alkalisoli]
MFVPFKVIWPDPRIPPVQQSMCHGWDPAQHLEIGQALRPLRDEGVLIVGSGQTYHNLGGGFCGGEPAADAFDDWLRTEMVQPETRDDALIRWVTAPGARHAQPEEDRLLPLMVAAGAASGDPGHIDFHGQACGKPISGFRFGIQAHDQQHIS